MFSNVIVEFDDDDKVLKIRITDTGNETILMEQD